MNKTSMDSDSNNSSKTESSADEAPIEKERSTMRTRNHKRRAPVQKKQVNIAKMTEIDYQNCVKITNKLSESIYSFGFRTPPDPTDEDGANFIAAVDKPMDLRTIQENLTNRLYKTVAQWKSDVNLIFENAFGYYSPKTMRHDAAIELKMKYTKLLVVFNKTEEDLWLNKLEKLCNELMSADVDE